MKLDAIHNGDALEILKTLPDCCVQTCITSPPYWGLRDYGNPGQLGLEQTPDEYVSRMVDIFREVRRVLKDDGTLWLNLGDSYSGSQKGTGSNDPERSCKQVTNKGAYFGSHVDNAKSFTSGLKPKDLVGIPWRVAFALQADGWYLRSDIIWHKPNPMPESVKDRPTKAHEYIFLMSKSKSYYYDSDAIKEKILHQDAADGSRVFGGKNKHGSNIKHGSRTQGNTYDTLPSGRNRRSVWTVATKPYSGAHFAVFPEELIEPCVLAGSAEGDTILDPFIGSGTTAIVALRANRRYIGIELNSEYIMLANKRISPLKAQGKLL